MRSVNEQVDFVRQVIIKALSKDVPDIKKIESNLEKLKEMTDNLPPIKEQR